VSLTPVGCKELSLDTGSLNVQISSGDPELIVQDRFSTSAPRLVHQSADARLSLSIFENHYQVHDQSSGDLLLDRPGTAPQFSPTGRYATAQLDFGRMEIVDTVSRRVIYVSSNAELGHLGSPTMVGWANEDALFILSLSRQGTIAVGMPLINDRTIFAGDIGCNNNCSGFGSTALVLDFDRLAFTVATSFIELPGNKMAMSLLEVAATPADIAFWNQAKPQDRPKIPPRRPVYKVAAFDRPLKLSDRILLPPQLDSHTDWQLSDKLHFTVSTIDQSDSKLLREGADSHLLKPKLIDVPTVIKFPKKGRVARRAFVVDGKPVAPKDMFERLKVDLASFQVSLANVNVGTRQPHESENGDEIKWGTRLAQSIQKTFSSPSAPLHFLEELPKAQQPSAVIAKETSYFQDEISAPASGKKPHLPYISGRRMEGLWQFP
jgi:hypothetical protein